MIAQSTLQSFGLNGKIESLSGGSGAAYRIGDVVLKRLEEDSLETEHSLELAPWLLTILYGVEEEGFRLARPIPTRQSQWITDEGWTAWTAVSGRPVESSDVVPAIHAIRALHERVSNIEKHPLLDQNTTAWGVAHRHCWEEKPSWVHPEIEPVIDKLYSRLVPISKSSSQLIHGDLNPGNVLISANEMPAIIDFTPFWAPANFALAIFANFIGPRRGHVGVLKHFEDTPDFAQLLFRAAIRMLLVVSELRGIADWHRERRAAELILGALD